MKHLFRMDSPATIFMTKVADCIWMSILWLVCSLPVITIGASTTALYQNMMHLHHEKKSGTAFFFQSFAENFKKSTIVWLILLLAAAVLLLGCYGITKIVSRTVFTVAIALFFVILVLLLTVIAYSFPLLSYYENTISGTLKNALFMGLLNPGYTLLAILFLVIPAVLPLFGLKVFLFALPFLVLFWAGGTAYVMSIKFEKLFLKYFPEESDEDSSDEEPFDWNSFDENSSSDEISEAGFSGEEIPEEKISEEEISEGEIPD